MKNPSDQLIHNPVKRKEIAYSNRQRILDFLRDEIYSSTRVLSEVVGLKERGTRRLLMQMVSEKLLVIDEVKFLESPALRLWGISPTGLLSHLDSERRVLNMSLRYHLTGRVAARTVEHTLLIQRVRSWCSPNNPWTPTRLMAGHECPRGHADRWPVYPDGLEGDRYNFELSALLTGQDYQLFTYAHEIERTRKSPKRYITIIRGHLTNMEKRRYSKVVYWCESRQAAVGLRVLFSRLVCENAAKLPDLSCWLDGRNLTLTEKLERFEFTTYKLEDLLVA